MKLMVDDATFVAQALQEYRERSWDDTDLADLPEDVQNVILKRAHQLKSMSEEKFAA